MAEYIITPDQKLQIYALVNLGHNYKKMIEDAENSIKSIINEEPDEHGYYEIGSEIIWETDGTLHDLEQFFKARGIKVTHPSVLELVGGTDDAI
jgi:hypothetical protein